MALQGFLATKHMNEHDNDLKEDPQELENKEIQGKKAESVVCQNVHFLVSTLNPCSPHKGWSIQEVIHHLLSHKCLSATNEIVKASLDGS